MNNKNKKIKSKRNRFVDALVILISLMALAALVFILKDSRSKPMEGQYAVIGDNYQGIHSDVPIQELIDYIAINEVNQTGWIEFYNKDTKTDIKLKNCSITVNGVSKYTFSDEDIIKAGQYLCIEGLGVLGNKANNIIGITDETGCCLKNILFPELMSDESYGCISDGEIYYYYLTASKERSNLESTVIKKDQLSFSAPGGFYSEDFQLDLAAAEGMTIYYTLDGTEPTIESEVYDKPILIENKSGLNMKYATAEGVLGSYRPTSISIGMVVRAIAVDKNGVICESKAQSYFIGLKNASDIKNFSVISIITDPVNLFDYFEGIYVSGRSHEDSLSRGEDGSAANYMNGWEKDVHIEYFEAHKDKTYEGEMSISIFKDYCVTQPQKSMLLKAEGGVFPGSGLLDYFNDKNNQILVQTYRVDNNFKIRESLAKALLVDLTVATADIKPCIVFINGEYWGGYLLRSEYDENYIKAHFNINEAEVLIAKNGKIDNKSGYQKEIDELFEFIANNDMKVEDNYNWVKAHMDVQNYLEYFCTNMYLANAEYGQLNTYMWKSINNNGTGYEDGRWRFLMPRLDNTMRNVAAGSVATSSVNTYLQYGATNDMIFRSLLYNDEFKAQLTTVMNELAVNTFSEERVSATLTEVSNTLKKMVLMSYKRFIGNQGDALYEKEIDKIEGFFQQRSRYILRYTEEVTSQGGNSKFYGDDAVFE